MLITSHLMEEVESLADRVAYLEDGNLKFLLPVHDKPAKVERGQIVGRLDYVVPGPISQTVQRRDWFPV